MAPAADHPPAIGLHDLTLGYDGHPAVHHLSGVIQPGADADLVIYYPSYRGRLSAKTQTQAVDYNAFEGWPIEGRPAVVTVRGAVAVRDGAFCGTVGRGRFLERRPSRAERMRKT